MKRAFFALSALLLVVGCSGDKAGKNVSPEAVDLGLPSGTLWANFNVGATAPEEYGNYYAWGEIETKSTYSDPSAMCGITIDDISGNATYDVAAAKWGDGWRMPTEDELEELINQCEWGPETVNGVNGYKFVGPNGNSIFLPAAGYKIDTRTAREGEYVSYWSSTPIGKNAYNILNRNGYGQNIEVSGSERYYGSPIRPVKSKQ